MPTRKNKSVTIRAEDCSPWEDSGKTRFLLRSLIVMRPREPFMEWVRGLHPDYEAVTLEHGQREGAAAFLAPLAIDESDMEDYFATHWQRFFAQALHRIEPDVERWPRRLSWEMTKEWFDIEVCREVFDLCTDRDGTDSVAADLVARLVERFGED